MKNSGEIFRFAVVGFSNFVIIMLTAWLLCDILAMNYLLANCCAYILALANNFYWNRVWVFRSDDRHIRRQIFLFLTAYGCAYVVQLAIGAFGGLGFDKFFLDAAQGFEALFVTSQHGGLDIITDLVK